MQQFFMAFVKAARVFAVITGILLAVVILVLIFAPEVFTQGIRYGLIALAAAGIFSIAAVGLHAHRNK